MGEFHAAVSRLLEAFSHGIAIIKIQRRRRRKDKVAIEPSRKAAETSLSKSLKRSRSDVREAYERDVSILGPGFAAGDGLISSTEEAHSSLSSILLRLNAGFVSIIERFTRGKSTPHDYQALVNLSNASRIEAMRTFEQLSSRLSHSSLALVPARNTREKEKQRRKRKTNKSSSSARVSSHTRAKSAPELTATPLGVATAEGWIRPKPGRKLSEGSRSSGPPSPKRSSAKLHSPATPSSRTPPLRKALPAPALAPFPAPAPAPFPSSRPPPAQPLLRVSPQSRLRGGPMPTSEAYRRTANRKSFMSFASDSTKLGEIPEHKWATPGILDGAAGPVFPITAYYPLAPYQEPEKPRSRFMRLFRRS